MSAPATTQGPAAHSVVLLDGAMGTELIARGLELTVESPERWVLTRPEVVRAVHAEYAAAGAQVLQTNTFGGSRPRLVRHGLDGELARIHRDALALARAGGPGLPVYASLGPTGIDPYAAGSAEAMRAAYEEQIAALVGPGGADGLHFETMLHPLEAVAGVRAARSVAPRVRVIVSSTYALGDHGFQMTLSRRVPGLIAARLRPWLEAWLGDNGLSLADVKSWAVHPGGPKIVSAVGESLGLTAEALAPSLGVFAEYGNMSSPTVLFIVRRLREANAPRPCVALGFGPGLVAEAALFV